jgi:hypothetical protein
MNKDFLIEKIGDRTICLKGIGKMFFQEGFPISMAVSILKKKGIEVSIIHVADECLKNGWSPKTTFNKLKVDFEDDTENNTYDLKLLKMFCNSSYEEQREIIFQYLFNTSTDSVRNNKNNIPLNWLKSKI